jgi:pectinesterase
MLAQGRDNPNSRAGYVINKCDIGGNSKKDTYYLGRPWRRYSRVMYQNSKLGGFIHPAGWSKWNATEPTDNVQWAEYGNSGAGAAGNRAYSKKVNAPTTRSEFWGSGQDSWVDMKYMGGR